MKNETHHHSRRSLLMAGSGLAAAVAARPQTAGTALTAGQVIDRIKENVGVPWRAQTVDNIIAGDADMPVKGIATTMMATLDVIQRSVAAGKNMVITHESTYFMHQDETEGLENDPTYRYKTAYLRDHDVVVFHFHDHWHARRPDGIATGMVQALGWEKNTDAANVRRLTFPGVPLARFTKQIADRLSIRAMRVVGDPALPVGRVATSWGYCSRDPGIRTLGRDDVDVLIVGETREWELVEYAQDAIVAGKKKALIVMGHVVSEQSGMKLCAEWLRPFIKEVPIEFIAATEPFWSPDRPVALDRL